MGGALMTGSAAAQDGGSYTAELTGEPLGVDTNAGGTATVSVSDGEASYELWVSCLRDGTHVSLSADGEVLAEYDLDVEGVVRDTVVLEGTTDDEGLLDALEGEVTVTAHTEQNPDGEIEGTLSAVDEADPAPEEPAEEEEPEDEPEEEPDEESEDEEEEGDEEEEPAEDVDLQDALEVVDRQTDVGHDTDNEYILFENTSDSEVDLSGHVVTDRVEGGTGIEAAFPDGFTLGPGDQVRVTSGSGSPTDDEIFMNSGRAVWRQDGDEVLVVGPGGDVVFSYSYGDGGTSSIQFVFNQVRSLFA